MRRLDYRRLEALEIMLEDQAYTLDEIAAWAGVTPRTAYRWIEVLTAAGVPVARYIARPGAPTVFFVAFDWREKLLAT